MKRSGIGHDDDVLQCLVLSVVTELLEFKKRLTGLRQFCSTHILRK